MTRSRSFIGWLLILVIALIAYGSLYPFNFKPDAIQGGVFRALEKLSWARAGRSDHIANVLLYLPLGFCLFLWLSARLRRHTGWMLATLLSALLSLTIEVAQVYVSARVPSLKDLALNTLGAALGATGGLLWRGIAKLMHLPTREELPTRDPGAALVVVTWLVFRFAPFVPQLDLGKLKAALRPLFEPQDGADPNTNARFELVRVGADGKPRPQPGLKVSLIREHRDYHWRNDDAGWRYEFTRRFETVETRTLDADSDATRFDFPV